MDQTEEKQCTSILNPIYLHFPHIFWNAFEFFFAEGSSLSQIRAEAY